jgi:hypothetical protein
MIDEAKDSLSTDINDDASSEQVASNRLKEVEEENQKLRKRLWNLQYKGNVAIGIALLSIGGIALILSYVLSSLIVTFIGLGLVLWGILIFSASSSRRVPSEVVYAISTSITESLYDLLSNFDGKVRKVVFFYPNHLQGFTQGHIFVSYDPAEFRIPEDQARTFLDDPRGIAITAPGQALVSLFEKELGINFATVDLDYIQQAMPGLLVDNLRIADDFLIEGKGDGIFLAKVVGDLPSRICKSNGKKIEHGNEFGCPICSSLALIISKFTGKPVVIRESQVKGIAVTSTFLALDV